MNKIITATILSCGVLAASIQASSACMLRTPLPPYCHAKCVINTWGDDFWEFEKCYLGAPNPNADEAQK